MVHAGQIYFMPSVDVGRVNYGRPCLVLRTSSTDASVCYFTTKIDYNSAGRQVIVYSNDPDFPASGLSESSCIMDKPISDVPLSYFNKGKLRGIASGDFKKRIEEWYGAPL